MADDRLKQRRLELWLQRPEGMRTENDYMNFYGWLVTNRRELVPICAGDPYQILQAELSPYVRKKPGPN